MKDVILAPLFGVLNHRAGNHHMIDFKKLTILIFIALFIYSCSTRNPDPPATSPTKYAWENPPELNAQEKSLAFSIDTFFRSKVKHIGFNGCVLVADHNKIIYRNSFGYSDYKKKLMLNDSSTFQLASTSKPFTATAILMLSEQGKLNMDDHVTKYISGFPYDSITIRMLLNHRSGLANYVYLFDTIKFPADSFISNQQVVDYFIENKPPLQSTPGHHFHYCNSNYALLAYIVGKVSHQSYDQFLLENIFQPAHMYHTYVHEVRKPDSNNNQTCAYHGLKWNAEPLVPSDGVFGDKGIYSTPYDLFLFDQALNHGILLKKETLDEAYKGYSFEKPGVKNYGLGWRLKEFPNGEKLIYHNGWWRGYNSLFDRCPDRGICVVVLTNKYNRSAYNVTGLFDLLKITDGDSEEQGE